MSRREGKDPARGLEQLGDAAQRRPIEHLALGRGAQDVAEWLQIADLGLEPLGGQDL